MLIGISDQMGTRFDRLRYEVFQNLILSPMNTGLLRPAVATVLTVYGIETNNIFFHGGTCMTVATVLTVYGIETLTRRLLHRLNPELQQFLPFTVLKLLCFENLIIQFQMSCNSSYRLRY